MIAKGSLKIGNRSKAELMAELEAQKFQKDKEGFEYLLNIPLWSLTLERMQKLEKEKNLKAQELKNIQKSSSLDMWKTELLELKKELLKEIKPSPLPAKLIQPEVEEEPANDLD